MGVCGDLAKKLAEGTLFLFNFILFIGGIVVLAFGAVMLVKVFLLHFYLRSLVILR